MVGPLTSCCRQAGVADVVAAGIGVEVVVQHARETVGRHVERGADRGRVGVTTAHRRATRDAAFRDGDRDGGGVGELVDVVLAPGR